VAQWEARSGRRARKGAGRPSGARLRACACSHRVLNRNSGSWLQLPIGPCARGPVGPQARLTLATTHHAELKRVAEEDGRYVNVSMAFDTASLRPSYRLVWGAAGASNALDIAQSLGFDWCVTGSGAARAQHCACAGL
jgi:hypothetical protein